MKRPYARRGVKRLQARGYSLNQLPVRWRCATQTVLDSSISSIAHSLSSSERAAGQSCIRRALVFQLLECVWVSCCRWWVVWSEQRGVGLDGSS